MSCKVREADDSKKGRASGIYCSVSANMRLMKGRSDA